MENIFETLANITRPVPTEKIALTTEEIGVIELALEETVNVLKNRFREENGYVHPALKYQALLDKLTAWNEAAPVGNYTLCLQSL